MRKKQAPVFSKLGVIRLDESRAKIGKDAESIADIGCGAKELPLAAQGNAVLAPAEFISPDSLAMTFVELPPGTFFMGSPENEPGRNADEYRHQTTLSRGLLIQTTPVTQRQWRKVMGTEPAMFKSETGDRPVEGISWMECREFIKRLNSIGGLPCRLPTEAEWEYACRAASDTPFCSGEILELYCGAAPGLDAVGWYCGNSGRRTHSVARKKPNAWGLYDMHGNVSEWCSDWYGPYPEAPATDPMGPDSGLGRVVRGGSWFSSAKNCRSASRFWLPPNSAGDTVGFRLVRDLR